jgi:hypothetical protein
MINYKVQHGVRILSNDEKLLMFGLVDKEMRDNIHTLKKMVGIKSPVHRRQKNTNQHLGISSIDSSANGKKSS